MTTPPHGAPPGSPGYGPPGYPAYGPPGYPGYGPTPPGYGPPLGPTSPRGEPLAAFETRLLAVLIDGVILGIVGGIIAVPATLIATARLLNQIDKYDTTDGLETPDIPFSVFAEFLVVIGLVIVLSILLSYLYRVELALRGGGQTPGKRIMKIRIVPLDPAQMLTRRHLAVRFLATFGLDLVPGLSWVDGLWQLWDKPYRQCLHDKAAQTVVVRLST